MVEVAAVAFAAGTDLAVGISDRPPDVASVTFAATATLEVATRPVGVRRRLVVVDVGGRPFGELDNATVGDLTDRLEPPETFSFTLPADDPKVALLTDERFREVQMWRGDQLLAWGPAVRVSADAANVAVEVSGVAWYLTRRHIGKATRTNHLVNGDFEAGLGGWRIGALSPFEPLANRNPAYWSATLVTSPTLTGRHSLRLAPTEGGLPLYGVQASQFLIWSVDPATTPEGDTWALVARCYIPAEGWIGPPPDRCGIRIDRFSTYETITTVPEGGGPVEYLPKPIESVQADIDENTPRGTWLVLRAELRTPFTGQAEFVQVTLGCPLGPIIWDRAALSRDEATRFHAADQADIVAELVAHLQDPAYGKSDLNLATDTAPTGVLRDRTYLHHEHLNGFDAIAEFCSLADGFDLSVAYTATTRTLRTHHPSRGVHRPQFALELGRNVADFAWTFDGENAADSVIVLGTGDGSDREETAALDTTVYADGLTLETVFSAPPGTPIDSLAAVADETVAQTLEPELLSVTMLPVQPGQPDPVGVLRPGDTVPVNLGVTAGTYRIVEVTVAPDDTVGLTLNRRQT